MKDFITTLIALFRGEVNFGLVPVPVPRYNPTQQDSTPSGDWPEGDNIAWTDGGFRRNG